MNNPDTRSIFNVPAKGAIWVAKYLRHIILTAPAVSMLFCSASAQNISRDSLVKLTAAVDTFRNIHPIEKLYLQFDKPYYSLGDTIWFKAYLFNAAYLTPSAKSGLLYIELTNDSDKVVSRQMLPVANGMSWGNITLDAKEIPEGSYTLRAYTNWMLNFGEDYILKKRFYLGNTIQNSWLVNTNIKLLNEAGTDKAHLNLQFYQLNKLPVILKDMELDVRDGKKIWYKSKIQTKMDGSVDVGFALKSNTKQLTLIVRDVNKAGEGHQLVIPVALNRPQDIDLQFMPEGGSLVTGLPAYIGFKAINADGEGTDVEGVIYDSEQHEVAAFKTIHKGMGTFYFTPLAGESYTAKVTLPGNLTKIYRLPQVQNGGTVLKVRNIAGADSLAITVTASQPNGSYYLTGQSRGIVCYASAFNLVDHVARLKVAKAAFPTGIARFTLLNGEERPLNERIAFINHHDNLQIDIKPDKPSYKTRDSIAFAIHVSDKNRNPVKANFSISVTDDSQVKTDSTGNNIITKLLLTSDLKGNIEEPGYYFGNDADGRLTQQLDVLLLTQGWVGYNWKDIFSPQKKELFAAEPEFTIKGSVANAFNKPLKNNHVLLFSKKPALLLDTVTDMNGRFIFKNVVPLDTPVFLLQARNRNGKSFNVGVTVDEFKPPIFNNKAESVLPWYVNSDSTLTNYVKTNIITKTEREKLIGGHALKEVVIKAKKIIKDSQNLNGPGNADVVIDEQELEKAGKKTFLELLQEKVPGFKVGFMLLSPPPVSQKVVENRRFAKFIIDDEDETTVIDKDQYWYYVNSKPVKFIIDGIPLYKIMSIGANEPAIGNITDYLNAHSAEDIKGIEVNSSAKYTSRYLPVFWASKGITPSDLAFIEITTRSGGGPGIGNTPGTYLYKPLPFSLPKQFYTPRYAVKNKDITVKDYRSTIYWQPNLVTDNRGNATVSFYSADIKGSYTVTIEGTDWNGYFGSKKLVINISGK